MECKLYDIIELGNQPASGNLILGEVLAFHINNEILDNENQIDPYKLDPIARNGGSWYTDAKKGLFELRKPKNIGIGFDQLPQYILNSDLTGNELARLASIESIPLINNKFKINNTKNIVSSIKKYIEKNDVLIAWQLVLHLGQQLDEK